MSNNPDTSTKELREQFIHVIESAYQDMQGVIHGRKGYRLRHEELADHLMSIFSQALQSAKKDCERNVVREAFLSLKDDVAKYGDGETVYFNGEAVVPISVILSKAHQEQKRKDS